MKNYQNHLLTLLLCLSYLLANSPAKSQPYEGIEINSSLFNDNVWFFGTSWTGTGCPGVAFTKNNLDKWVPQNYSGKGKVNSWENSLSVSTPSCDGSFIFYTMHNQVYNSNHAPMDGGNFSGNTSVADGLAACYIGNNKYYLFSCNTCYFSNISLLYYEIDMSQNGGLGKMTYKGSIETGMSESIELIPVKGTSDEYWLVYYHFQAGKMKVRKVTPSSISGVITQAVDPGPNLSTNIGVGSNYSFMLKSNATYNQLVLTIPIGANGFYLYDFDPATGQIRQNRFVSTAGVHSSLYNADFSPNGRYIYYSSYSANNKMYQYDIKNSAVVGTPIEYTNITSGNVGGGLKRGPDGRMYVGRAQTTYLGIIETPDLPRNDPNFKYTMNGLNLGVKYDNLPLSTGLTPPAKDPTTISTPPVTQPDYVTTTNTMPITVDVLANDEKKNPSATTLYVDNAFIADPSKVAQGTVSVDATKKKVTFTPAFSYPFTDGEKVYITYVAKDDGTPINMCNSEQIEITIRTDFSSKSTLFNDNVWFFGSNWSGPGCPAVTFVKDGSNNWQPKDITATEKAQVKSWENSLSVSTPACDGNFVFYTSHDTVYNSNHVPMSGKPKGTGKDGAFWGHNSVADGLGACYVGNNKYFLISSSTAHEGGNANIQLRYYIIDMSKDNGLGEIRLPSAADGITDGLTDGIIMNGYMSESLEVIPVPETSDEYWLIYHTTETTRRMIVRKITPKGISAPVCTINSMAENVSYVLSSNTTHTMLSLVLPGAHKVLLYNFNPLTGQVEYRAIIDFPAAGTDAKYGTLFSPNGRYLYASSWRANRIAQFDLYNNNAKVGEFSYNSMSTVSTEQGGGMKLGPDGKIYVALSYTRYVGRIETPNLPKTDAGFIYNEKAVELSLPANTTYRNLPLSTGLTPPAVDPLGTNLPPIVVPDVADAYTVVPTVISPLDNDSPNSSTDADELFLTKAQLVNAADAVKGTVTFDAATKTVTFTPSQLHTFTDGDVIVISYTARDNQTPVGMCETGTITLTMRVPQLTVSVPNPKQHNEGTKPMVTVCLPSGLKAPDGGLPVTLTQVASVAPMAASTDFAMPATVTILKNQECVSFELDLKGDLLIEGNESLKIEATATNCKPGSDELLIIDRTDGAIIIEINPEKINEGPTPGTGTFTIRFSVAGVNCPNKKVKIEYTVSGTAKNGTHYTITPNSNPAYTYINAGQTSTTVTVQAINDFIVDGGRDVKIVIDKVTLE